MLDLNVLDYLGDNHVIPASHIKLKQTTNKKYSYIF